MKQSRILYYFDNATLQYQKIKKPKFNKLKMVIITILLFTIGSLPISLNVLRYTDLKLENRKLKTEYLQINKKIDNTETYVTDIFIRNDSIYREFLDLKDITPYIKNPYSGGVDRYSDFKGHSWSDLIINTHKNIDLLLTKLKLESNSYKNVLDEAIGYTDSSKIPGITPIKVDYLLKENVSGFGMRMHPILKYKRMHNGVDLTTDSNVGVYSTADGIVKEIGKQMTGLGNFIIINHLNGYETTYAHLNSINVVKKQKIKMGDIIGLVGSTGLSTRPHLHYEIRLNGKAINPEEFFGVLKKE